jgi:hypothetical protein
VTGDRQERSRARLAAALALEDELLARRLSAPDVPRALAEALAEATGATPGETPAVAAARAIAAEVERFGSAFPGGAEPPYHDRHHQAEAVLVMGRLCGHARRAGLIDACEATVGVAAMAAHDLHHPGRPASPPGTLERQSAEAAIRIAAGCGAPPEWRDRLGRIVLATQMPQPGEDEDVPIMHRLAHEADVCASVLPRLGRRLSQAMAAELHAAGDPAAAVPGTHAGRLAFLRAIPGFSAQAEALGLAAAHAAQLDAYASCARMLGAGDTPEAGAAALDRLGRREADALLDRALAEAGVRA